MPADFDCLIFDKAAARQQGVLAVQEYDRQKEDAAMTDEEKQARQAKADADQAAMWESIGNVSPCQIPLPLHSLVSVCNLFTVAVGEHSAFSIQVAFVGVPAFHQGLVRETRFYCPPAFLSLKFQCRDVWFLN